MRRYALQVLFLLMTVVVIGCSTATENGDPRPAFGTASSSTSASTVPEKLAASVTQFASLIAEHKGEWDDQVATTEENCLDPETIPACGLGYMTLKLQAETLHLILTGAHKEGHPNYIGEPPEEITQLLADTEAAAAAVPPAVDTFQASECIDPLDPECLEESVAMSSAVDELSQKLDAWSAY